MTKFWDQFDLLDGILYLFLGALLRGTSSPGASSGKAFPFPFPTKNIAFKK